MPEAFAKAEGPGAGIRGFKGLDKETNHLYS